ncbi:hypothetical protein TVAG_099170 [Trichomonas vaginalis G3]|uniref:DSC E3 ubiquitin ligase complex subunit 3 C-terminal domain-containing protein n=1 Tax=Trichomonas vaginalis (strain ATCC PRA-98 / G3) TaxID=412133 RepID=A2G7G7_TRIV3|nr:transmembrane protein YOR223W family [Trichomonas vaginalis G3]EAX86901.1 hypothetical protein TVAG_099170 [Trichomonas vaginalis G3]KAI5485118.1 transmembrane protein YOR223W family [Trichomonas vaginalis G3]|eukprot:XP_001299831.1 hypothetical protein [Trichomonas vaginalis G3]
MLKINVILPGDKHLQFNLQPQNTTKDLISMIKNDSNVQIPRNKILTLIYRGRILTGNEILSSFDSMTEFTIQGFYRNDPNSPNNNNEEIIINDLRGFDRLRRMNYTPEQIQEIRNSFHSTHQPEDGSQQSMIDLEEEWFPVLFNQRDIGSMIRANLPNLQNFAVPAQPNQATEADAAHEHPQNEQANNDHTENNNAHNSPLINNNDDDRNQTDNGIDFPGQDFLYGLIFGLFFGIPSVMLVYIDVRAYSFVAGIIIGTIINALLTTY